MRMVDEGIQEQPASLSIYFSVCLSVSMSFFLPVSLPTCLSASLSTSLSVYLSLCLPVSLSLCLSVYLSLCLPISLSFCLPVSVYLSICLSVYLSLYDYSRNKHTLADGPVLVLGILKRIMSSSWKYLIHTTVFFIIVRSLENLLIYSFRWLSFFEKITVQL